jgi:hypothetical protein
MIEWSNQQGSTSIREHSSTGDVVINQNGTVLGAHYDYWPYFLIHGILYCCQTGLETPNPRKLSIQNTERKDIAIPLLRTILSRAKVGGQLVLLREEDDLTDILLRFRSDSGKYFLPRISKQGNLIYLSELSRKQLLTFTPEDIPDFFEGVIDPMMRNVRGTKGLPELIYAEFPWRAYTSE